ncbi:alpha-13-mannosyltransferase [Anaeramoeba flamelloides]|uniref:dolichyl-P-Man:Man5GlcNAc2-PP-dolichol alpha-1,3-mannosyltransferase n=1 Tax=Anaeramoeba flamelloides TaxID=1746091 RepID=A0AAV7YAX4_9EUKA|nr:alpha-13-mannosyltransferase [Anaeramoeba flamelloides]
MKIPSFLQPIFNLLTNPKNTRVVLILVLCCELILNFFIVQKVPYTEIDWEAYMDEVAGPLVHDEWDYTKLRGGTGPLVYPAGFVWLYGLLYKLTDSGLNIKRAQYIFIGFYMVFIFIVLNLYAIVIEQNSNNKDKVKGEKEQNNQNKSKNKSKNKNKNKNKNNKKQQNGKKQEKEQVKEKRSNVSSLLTKFEFQPWILLCLAFSRRIHSIFVLRLFNDPLAMLLFYFSVYLMIKNRWWVGCFVYSLAVSIKMNIFLFAPGLLLLMLKTHSFIKTIFLLAVCAITQVVLAIPFLLVNPLGYLNKSFELSRKFFYIWSVNWQFLPEDFFLSNAWSYGLLALQLGCYILFATKKWISHEKSYKNALNKGKVTAEHFIYILFTSNFIGIVFSRSLHYQFFVWYYHTIPYLLIKTKIHWVFQILILLAIEVVWNVYPPNAYASLALNLLHLIVLILLFLKPVPKPRSENTKKTN